MNDRNHQNLAKRRISYGGWAGLLVSLAVLFCQAPLAWSATPATHVVSKIGPGVLEELRDSGGANVMIALAHPSAARASGLDMAAMKSQIAQMQTDVLAQLGLDDYKARHTYSAVPALAGRVKSEAALVALARHPSVLKVDLDVGGTGSLANSVPVIGADLRHASGNSGTGVVVAVLDSGLDTDHLNLGDNLIAEACFLDNDGSIDGSGLCPNGSDRQTGVGAAEDDAGHGSHVTGIITSNGSLGSVGVAPDASIAAIKVTAGPSLSGVFFFFSEIVAALDYIINNPGFGVQVINISLGTWALFTGDCDASTAFNMAGAAAINTLRANGVTAFASAGNNGSSTQMTSPACLSNVISVGASDNTDTASGFTNSNASTDIFAPGVNVLSSNLGNGTTTASGTSMASSHAAGCAALLIQNGEAVNPDQIEARLESSAVQVLVAANGLSFPRIDCNPQVPLPDSFEPDNNSAEASVIEPGVLQAHNIAPIGDEDWTTFTLTVPSEVNLATSGASGDTRMWLYDANQNLIEFDGDGGADLFSLIDRQCSTDELPAGTYFVQIDEFGDNNTIDSYTIDLTVTLCPDDDEPNNDFASATPVSCPEFQRVNGTIAPLGDVDYFLLTGTTGGTISIDIDAAELNSTLNSSLGVFNSALSLIGVNDDTPAPGEQFTLDSYLEVTIPPDGLLYIAVSSYSDFVFDGIGGLTVGSYNLTAVCDSDGDGLIDSIEDSNGNGIFDPGETDPLNPDTDGDGFTDGEEVSAGTDPLDDTSFPIVADGDVNGDGQVDVADLLLAMQILQGQHIPTPAEEARMDVAPLVGGVPMPDGEINLGDYVVLQRKVIGEISF